MSIAEQRNELHYFHETSLSLPPEKGSDAAAAAAAVESRLVSGDQP